MKSSRTKKFAKIKRESHPAVSRVKKRRDNSMPAVPLYSDSDYESLLENSRDVIYRFDIVKRLYTYVSPSSSEVLGIKPAVFLKKKYGVLTPLLHKDEREFLKEHLRKIFKAPGKGRKSFYVEYRVKMPEGDYKWVADNHTIVYGLNGKPESVIGNITDITFRKNTQEELVRSFELQKGYLDLLSSVQDALPAHIAMLDNHGNIVTVNESWRSFADGNALLTSNFGIGVNYLDVCEKAKGDCSDEAKSAAEGIRSVLNGKLKEFELDYPCHSPNEQRWFRMVCAPISRKSNKGAVIMHINTTERKLAEAALQESEAQYRQLFIEDLTGNYIADLKGRVLLCNPAFAQMFGFKKPEDLWNAKKFNVFSEKKGLAEQIKQLKRGEKIPLHERTVTSMNGIKKIVLENLAGRYDSDGKLMSIQGYILDITGMKNAEEALRLSEEQYRVLFYDNPLPMWIFDFDTLKFIAVNDSAVKHYGYSRKEFLGMTLYEIRPEAEKKVYRKYRDNIIRQNKQKTASNAGIWKHRKKNGEIIDVEITRRPVEFEGKEAVLILANDVTERIRSEEVLKKRNRDVNLLYLAGKEFSSSLDTEKIYESVYDIVSEIMPCDSLVISSYEAKTKHIKCLALWQNRVKIRVSGFPELRYDEKGQGTQSKVIKSGEPLIVNDYDKMVSKSSKVYFMKADGKPAAQGKKAHKIERSVILIPMKLRGKVIGVIQVRSYEQSAYTKEDLRILEAISGQLNAAIANARLYNQAQHEIQNREKTEKELKKKTEELTFLYKAERALSSTLQKEKIYDKLYSEVRKMFQCDSMVISSYSDKDKLMRCESAWIENTKHNASDFPPLVHGSGGEGTQSEVIRTGKAFIRNDFDKVIRKNTSRYLFDEKGNVINPRTEKSRLDPRKEMIKSAMFVPMKLSKKVIGVISVFSFEKNAFTENDLRLLQTLSTQVSASTVNAALYRQAQDEIKERKKAELALNAKTLETSFLYEAQKTLSSSLDMTIVYNLINKIVSDKMSCDSMIISSFDKKKSEIKLLSVWADGVKADMLEVAPIPLAPKGFGIQSEVIRTGESKLISNYEEYYSRSITKVTYTDNKPLKKARRLYSSALLVPMKIDGEVIGVIQVLSYKKSAYDENDLKLLESLTGPITAATINASLYHQAQTEIAERSRKEKELSVIKKSLEEAQRIAHVGSWFYDLSSNSIRNSAEINRILGAAPEESTLHFEEAINHIHEEDKASSVEKLKKALNDKVSYTNEDRIKRPDGEIRFVKIVGEPIFDESGKFTGMQGTMQDITDIKKINEELKKSLGEKELMLKEIHHRVKNNLQIVSSLLRLQSDKVTDTAAVEYLKQSEQRVKSMALIHQQLYKTKDLARIDFGDYIRDLCTYLFFSYGVSRSRVDFVVDVKDIFFSIDTALPCGLILNELVTNSIKHGFPGEMRGTVTISLYKDAEGKNQLMLKDDGKGSGELDFENTSTLGMELVQTLTEQLEGEITVNTDSGTEIKISFFDLS